MDNKKFQHATLVAGDGLGLGPYWRWSDLTDHKDYANWDRGYPQNLYTSTAQCAILTKDGYWRNLDCTISDGTSPSQHVCKAKKGKRYEHCKYFITSFFLKKQQHNIVVCFQ